MTSVLWTATRTNNRQRQMRPFTTLFINGEDKWEGGGEATIHITRGTFGDCGHYPITRDIYKTAAKQALR